MTDPWMKFYPQDWQGDEGLQMASLAARGLWVEILCIMHKNGGYLSIGKHPVTDTQLAIKVGVQVEQITALVSELEHLNVFSRTRAGVIYSRRMLRDMKKAKTAKQNGKSGGNPSLCKERENQALVNQPDKRPLIPPNPEARSQKENLDNPYVFEGKVIRLRQKDFAAWLDSYGGTHDQFFKWLDGRDEWLSGQAPEIKKRWFISTGKAITSLSSPSP